MNKPARYHFFLATFAALAIGAGPSGLAQSTLVHRYSFNEPSTSTTFADSVGGASWNGTLAGTAVLDGSMLQLDGFGAFATLPASIVHTYSQVSIEFWATFGPNNPFWTRTFAFGDQNASAGENTGMDYCHYAGGDWQNMNVQNSAGGVYANNHGGLNGQTNIHVTIVVDPVANKLYYYNGTVVMSNPVLNNGAGGTVPALSGINDTICLLGKSLYDQDATLEGAIDEFRIYSGVVPGWVVALNDVSGPNSIVTNPGPVQALHFSSPVNPLVVNQSSQQTLRGDFTNLTGVDLVLYGGATFSSLNASVVTIDTNGVVKAVGLGTGKVVASFGGLSATNTLTVISLPAVLTHRYSFTNDATDSVGGANGTLMGNAAVTGGQLVLDGTFGTHLDLPAPQINIATNMSVTFDAWVTFGAPATWAYLFGFGDIVGSGGQNHIACVPASENGGFRHWGITENFAQGITTFWAHSWNNMTAHITCVVDPPTSTISIYRDGVLESAVYNAPGVLSSISTNFGCLGRSFYSADPYLNASIDEFRLYSGALTPAQVALTQKLGPNSASIDLGALSSITVAPTNYPAFADRVPPVILANYANLSGFNLLPNSMAGANATLGGPQGLVVTSSDTNIVSVNAQNMLTTHRPGTVTLSATYQGKTSSATVRVNYEALLTHRYTFNTDGDAGDLVGGANGTLQGGASVSGGKLQLSGLSSDYLELPPALLRDYDSMTIDFWVDLNAAQSWARLWQFVDGPGGANFHEFYYAPGWNGALDGSYYNAGFVTGGGNLFMGGGALGNQSVHLTCLYGNGSMEVYTNGVLQGKQTGLVAPASQAGTNVTWIGHSPFAADPGVNCAIDELRVYRGKLSPEEIQASGVLGPNQTLSTAPARLTLSAGGGNILVSWPVAAASFTLQATSDLKNPASWATLTNAPTLVGNTWQLSLPASGTAQFLRLIH